MAFGEGNEDPTGELGERGFRDVSGDAAASGMPTRAPDAPVNLHGDLSIWPGKVSPKGRWLTRFETLLLLEEGPGSPDRQNMLALKRQFRVAHQPLVGKCFLQMAGHFVEKMEGVKAEFPRIGLPRGLDQSPSLAAKVGSLAAMAEMKPGRSLLGRCVERPRPAQVTTASLCRHPQKDHLLCRCNRADDRHPAATECRRRKWPIP